MLVGGKKRSVIVSLYAGSLIGIYDGLPDGLPMYSLRGRWLSRKKVIDKELGSILKGLEVRIVANR